MIETVERDDSLVSHQILCTFRNRLTEKVLQPTLVKRRRAIEHKRLNGVVVLMMVLSKKIRFDFEDAVERKATDIEQIRDRGVTEINLLDRRPRVDLNQPLTH